MNDRCDETEACECNACVKARADFQRWCDAFEARWAKRFIIQADVTDGFAVCVVCHKETDPQTYDEHGAEHVEYCPADPATAPSGLLERAL